jgi:hypothetical protein
MITLSTRGEMNQSRSRPNPGHTSENLAKVQQLSEPGSLAEGSKRVNHAIKQEDSAFSACTVRLKMRSSPVGVPGPRSIASS